MRREQFSGQESRNSAVMVCAFCEMHGTRVSDAAVAPLKPPHPADVTSQGHFQLRGGELLRVSKRDAQCSFDQLKLYPELGVWMVRPTGAKNTS